MQGGKVEWKYQLERKSNWLQSTGFVESVEEDKSSPCRESPDIFKVRVSDAQFRQPAIRFSICPTPSRRLSQRPVGSCLSGLSVMNELAKMGDPNLLEMVQEEGKEPAGGRAGLRAWTPPSPALSPGGRWWTCGQRRGRSRRGVPARDGEPQRRPPLT